MNILAKKQGLENLNLSSSVNLNLSNSFSMSIGDCSSSNSQLEVEKVENFENIKLMLIDRLIYYLPKQTLQELTNSITQF